MNGMMKPRFALSTLSTLIALSISTTTFASDFSLPFVNGSELGNAYAGWAASATDASTSYTNPAGLIKLKSPQIVVAGVDVRGFSQFKGTSTTPFATQFGQVTGTAGGFLPLFDLAIPINDKFVFGFSETAPFGLGNNYPTWSVVRYAATRSQLIVVDLSPSIGYKINDKLSVGAGFDAQRVAITLNAMMPMPFSLPDAQGQNHLTGWGYGFHAGILDQINESTRVGLSFNSQTTFSPSGDSVVYSSMGTTRTTNQKTNFPLPARTQVSIYHDINNRLTAMGSIFYTRWSTLSQIVLQNTMTPIGVLPATIPLQYHDTFDYAAGLNFKATEKWLLKIGAQYFNTPSNDRFRSVPDPLGRMVLVGIGAHYQKDSRFGYDIAYAHDFFERTVIHYVTPVASLIGHSNTASNIFALQFTANV